MKLIGGRRTLRPPPPPGRPDMVVWVVWVVSGWVGDGVVGGRRLWLSESGSVLERRALWEAQIGVRLVVKFRVVE